MDSLRLRAYLTLVGSIFYMLFVGCFYLTGNISTYIQQYLSQFSPVEDSDIFILLPVMVIVQTVVLPFGSYLSKTYDPRLVIIAGASISLVGTFASSYTTSFYGFLFTYSVPFGLNLGLSYVCAIYQIWQYFPENKGLAGGIVLSGFGFGTFIFNFVSQALVNPDNLKQDTTTRLFPQEVLDRVPFLLRTLAACWLGLTCIALVMIKPYPKHLIKGSNTTAADEDTKESPDGDKEYAIKSKLLVANIQDTPTDHSNKVETILEGKKSLGRSRLVQCLMSKQFMFIYIMGFLSIFLGYYVSGVYKLYGNQIFNDDSFITTVGAFAFVFGGLRFFWSYLIDRYSFKLSYTIILVLQVILAFTFEWIKEYRPLFFIWVCVIIWCEGGHFVNLPTICSKLFGDQAVIMYGIGFSFCGLSNVLAIILIKFTLESMGYSFFFYISGAFSFIALWILLFFFKEDPIVFEDQK